MRQPPELQKAEDRMAAGLISRDGFLGSDRRPLVQILAEDENTVNSLGLTHARIAERMAWFGRMGRPGLGTTVTVEDRWEVRVQTVRGLLPCPWGHEGMYPKTNVFLRKLDTGETLVWTDLSVHMIGEHGFYEGRGSGFRVEPEKAARVLGLDWERGPDL
jgi:hypothetical protein